MRAPVIIIVNPRANFLSRVVEPEEQRLVEQLVPHATVEALAEAVLHWLAGHDEMPFDLVGTVRNLVCGAGGLCRRAHRNRRSAAQSRPASPIACCSPHARGRINRRDSTRRWMKLRGQVTRSSATHRRRPCHSSTPRSSSDRMRPMASRFCPADGSSKKLFMAWSLPKTGQGLRKPQS